MAYRIPRKGRLLHVAIMTMGAALSVLTVAQARYMRPDIVNLPVARLVENLEKQIQKDPKSVEPKFNLARLYAMAYAQKTDSAQVLRTRQDGELKVQEEKGAWFGYEPRHVPFDVKKTDDADQKKAAQENLKKAIARYDEVVKAAPTNLPARLGQAWCLEQSGDKNSAMKAYREVADAAWNKEKDMMAAPLGWHSITAETAGYLIPLLDADKDKTEITTLKERSEKMRKVPRPITPLVIPLRDGATARDLENRQARVSFDADGTGLKKSWTWITDQGGWLVFDPQRQGEITSALQLFGNVTFWCFWENGYHALAALDNDGDGWLTGKELDGLSIWHDANGNGVSEPGEVKTLSAHGIVALSCRYAKDSSHPDRIAFSNEGVRFRVGKTRPTYDIVLHPAQGGTKK